ncbi:Beta-galactosidase C-terminal domain [Paenibacillus sp. NPDC058367]|uniref:Beta-galactosidase C-terminal domain n=1 Tax=Paenibacillus sp. NPDC058367 TaxID=3346460 RepID=UPI00365C833F
MERLSKQQGLFRFEGLPDGVQASVRSGDQGSFLFLLNLNRESVTIPLPQEYNSLLNHSICSGELQLEPYGVEILEM